MWTDNQVKGKILHKCKAKEMSEELIKEGILHLKKTNYGKHVSINLDRKDKVMEYIDEFLRIFEGI